MSQYAYDFNPAKTQSLQSRPIEHNKFSAWTGDQLYRTSYGTHWTSKPQEPKTHVPPGYAGYIPGLKPNNHYGASYGEIAKNCLSNPKVAQNPFKLASTGFNYQRHDFRDPSLTATTHKFGAQTLLKNHPSIDQKSNQWQSQTHDSFRNPLHKPNPTYRETDKDLQTQKYFTKTSGFQQNHTTFDRTGWVPEKVLHADRTTSEYRIHFNKQVPFHRDTVLFKERRLPPKEYNYKYMG
ncbi:hypothetical protein TTHERM_00522810 (macronuclear) [Tetrahymena thermophila SB210]|uniref:Uncharacterized protein n=1 Tax=Tetrahymena thermophila (strain SB210) TaxID=312017 RepID=I7LUL4_TETTS|nr:hypothetical protein TTHERM_00522810 [Tetrahymena thermophila SB210]8G2Z_0A Chain 0A, RIB27A [Tetrahymena thermophila CU428]8G2Z_1A Chain 1A, RIB27A [Tetrahymena thermophila CU428]8G2Z_2A Chain 2A, RIB27A [Tetrahymena thermophila CU428]8G2Z_3A Chain 3A, RIB27A [Tetrahymena thermophila CU428]8G3D_0A Chain 0A, RIB27A [Tetrahymena thermophila]8G3D_1A Chain 1A, RIB27A [Tetrahymena thermophila]8G3D_2A Chain 2A, RIB27A [Tetrahymena thermophila]8G3D_3A Chain 3A, RIB27A [Tetrahymena thermophila]|eukprot:XP_001014459.3 hypothetical protein TTHERM_00522810 [Tetrahymena thermophila SB210]